MPLRQSRVAGMQRVDQCINGLMYKAADKAMGVGETKQRAEGNGDTHTRTQADRQQKRARRLLDREQTGDDMDVTAAGAAPRRL